jgi:transcriptional regulator with XRE-family HTH domain
MSSTDVTELDRVHHDAKTMADHLRTLRKSKRWTRKDMAKRLRRTISSQTLTTYELGTRAVPVFRHNEACGVLGVRASAVLAVAEEQVCEVTPPGGVTVNLRHLAATSIQQLGPARRWASLLAAGTQPVMQLTARSRALLADVCGIDQTELATLLNTVDATAGTAKGRKISEGG